jgi:hypothetical protein
MKTQTINHTATNEGLLAVNYTNNPQKKIATLKYDKRNEVLNLSSSHRKPLSVETYFKATQVVKYHLKRKENSHVHISLIKYNASSIKGLMNIFTSLNHNWKAGKEVSVSWITPWDDDEVFDLAYDFSELFDFPVDIIPG